MVFLDRSVVIEDGQLGAGLDILGGPKWLFFVFFFGVVF